MRIDWWIEKLYKCHGLNFPGRFLNQSLMFNYLTYLHSSYIVNAVLANMLTRSIDLWMSDTIVLECYLAFNANRPGYLCRMKFIMWRLLASAIKSLNNRITNLTHFACNGNRSLDCMYVIGLFRLIPWTSTQKKGLSNCL